MNMVRSFLLMLALLLAVDVPTLGAEIGTGSFVTSGVIGGVTALVQAYRTTKRKFEKKQARKYAEALEVESAPDAHENAQAENTEASDASSNKSEESIQKREKPKNFTMRKNLWAMVKNISPVAFVQGAAASLISLYVADQCYSFDDIENDLNHKLNINLQEIKNGMKEGASDAWYVIQWGTRATYAAAEVGCSRAYELMPEFRFGSVVRAMPLAAMIASYKMAKEAYTIACAKEENKHKTLSLYRDFPLIWQQRNWKTFKRWFIASGLGLYILDGFVQHERRALEASEHPACPKDHPQARKAYVRAYANHENADWADQVAQSVRARGAGAVAEQEVASQLQALDRFQLNEQRRVYIEENYEDIIAEGNTGFIDDFHEAMRVSQTNAQQNYGKAKVYADMVQNYYIGRYINNSDRFEAYAEQVLDRIHADRIPAAARQRLIAAVCRVAHYAAAHQFGRDERQAGGRAIDQLFAGKSAQCAVGYGIFASTHRHVAKALGV